MNSILNRQQRILLILIILCTLFVIGSVLFSIVFYGENRPSYREAVRKHEIAIVNCEKEGGRHCRTPYQEPVNDLTVIQVFATLLIACTGMYFIVMIIILSVGRFMEKLEQREATASSSDKVS
jgi:hypothetical protein